MVSQSQLDEWEQLNILDAEKWAFARKGKKLLSVEFVRTLHRRMFDKTWIWAGDFRKRQTNIGIEWFKISAELKKLVDDVVFQIAHQTFDLDEIVGRFHHRLVFIHAFPNGNGRHARLMADLLLVNANRERFSWGMKTLQNGHLMRDGMLRHTYIAALRQADLQNYGPLLAFVRS